jgi:hypothetical protein
MFSSLGFVRENRLSQVSTHTASGQLRPVWGEVAAMSSI